ncbi:MAG: RNase adapter RapZ, partial [Candidatus Aminicenantales bacterium]
MKNDRFLIITGISGSGKTVVSRFLEDLGYYCVDNLPAKLIPNLVELWLRKEVEIQKVALIVDMREPGFLADFPAAMEAIKKKTIPKIIFLDASDETLLKRFSETRRPHPLTKKRSVIEGIRWERKRLAPIKKMADEVLDTSST